MTTKRDEFAGMCQDMGKIMFDTIDKTGGGPGQMRLMWVPDGKPPEAVQNYIWRVGDGK